MKTLKLLSLLAVTLLLASCGGNAESVASKIDAGESLSQADYSIIINYCGDFAKEAQKFQNQIDALPDDSQKAATDESKLAELKTKYPLLEKFTTALLSSNPDAVGADNVKKVNELAKYIWFTAPGWATIQTDPAVTGFIEQTPASGQDSSVVAAGAGDVVEEKVKE